MNNPSLNMNDLHPLAVLGRGAKGVVFLVHSILSNSTFALKVVSKKTYSIDRRIWGERDLLLSLQHPLLPSLHGVVETDTIICFAIDYCSGGDLSSLRRRQTEQMFTNDIIKFYAAELFLVLDYLHSIGIVYRDLKPDNILVQENGHLMLVDFDLSIRLPSPPSTPAVAVPPPPPPPPQQRKRRLRLLPCFSSDVGVSPDEGSENDDTSVTSVTTVGAKSNSFVGTEEYVAPEVIKGDGHDFTVDWWGMGVVLYEMLYGKTPFRGKNRKETFQGILFKEAELVGEQTPLRDLIRRLLEKDPGKRISGDEIKGHAFFKGMDWEKVVEVGRPPFIPVEVEVVEGMEAIDVEKVVEEMFRAKVKEGNWQEQVKTGDDFSAF